MTSILIRCDASQTIGSGHVMRCRTLARVLQSRGAVVTFLCRRQVGDLIALLEQEFPVLSLPELPLLDFEGLVGRDLYRAWLGCSQEQDATDCLYALASVSQVGADWIVVDHYGLDATWERLLLEGHSAKSSPKLLVIDDLADRHHQADLLLDQNFFGDATDHRYQGLLNSQCRQLLGTHYALLGPEYAQLHPLVPERSAVQRVLVFFGGVDSENLTGRTLEALMDPSLAHLAVDVVVGRQSLHRQAVADLVAQRQCTTLHGPLPSLAGLIARADLAIGAGGATTWERACLKLPSLVVATADNQIPFAEALHKAGHLQLLGDATTVSVDQIRSALLDFFANPFLHAAGGDLTDGWGASRLVFALLGPQSPISLRPADVGDEALWLRWVTDRQGRATSFVQDLIASSDQHNWFHEALLDPNRLLLIAEASDGCPVGQMSFVRQPISPQNSPGEAGLDLSLDLCARGFGVTADLVRLGLKVMEQTWGPEIESASEVQMSNQQSSVCFCRSAIDQASLSSSLSSASGCPSLALSPARITLLSDRGSWLNPYLSDLIQAFWYRGHAVRWIHDPAELAAGDVCFMLSCGRLISPEQLALHRHNLVVHASDLPKGQGWSPMSWQILEEATCIPVTLFEAVSELDSGPIYLQQKLHLQGHELVNEWRPLLAQVTNELCVEWLDCHHKVVADAHPQLGECSYYKRRRPVDSQLDPELSLAEQFNLLRVVDNHCYPAFFVLDGRSYQVHVFGEHEDTQERSR